MIFQLLMMMAEMFNNLLFCNNDDVLIKFFGKMLINKNFFERIQVVKQTTKHYQVV